MSFHLLTESGDSLLTEGGDFIVTEDSVPVPDNPCDVNTLLSSAACFSCIPRGQLAILKLVILANILEQKGGGRPTVQELLDVSACFMCLTPGQLQILKIQLLCSILGGNVNYANEIPTDASILENDPPFFKQQSAFLLSGTNTGKPDYSTNNLTATFPDLDLLRESAPEFLHVDVDQVIFQRSSTTRSTPFSPTGDGTTNGQGVDQVAYRLLPTDPAWVTLVDQQFSPAYRVDGIDPADYAIVKTFSDPAGLEKFYNYRLIVILRNHTGDPGEFNTASLELDFNVVSLCTPFKLCFNNLTTCPDQIPQGPRDLVWNAPNL